MEAHSLRRWFENPDLADVKTLDPVALLFSPLVWLDWKIAHKAIPMIDETAEN
jgi:hypothetical protein